MIHEILSKLVLSIQIRYWILCLRVMNDHAMNDKSQMNQDIHLNFVSTKTMNFFGVYEDKRSKS